MDSDGIDRAKLTELNLVYQGRFVCHDVLDGGSCWGKVKEVVYVNTQEGLKLAFVLNDRYVRYSRGTDLKRFRQFHVASKPDETFFSVRNVPGDSILQMDKIDLETDIVNIDERLEGMDSDSLFLIFMKGREQVVEGKSAMEIGMKHLMSADKEFDDKLKRELQSRLNVETEDDSGNSD